MNNAILGYPCVMVQNGYFIPIFFLLTSGIVFRTLLGFRKGWSGYVVGGGGGGARGVYVAHGLCLFVCWSLTSLCHSNGHIETMPAREINPFTALTRIRSQFLRTQ